MSDGRDLGFARYLISIANQAVDAGDLRHGLDLLDYASAQIAAGDQTGIANELRVTVLLERATIHQHQLDLRDAERCAEEAVRFASEKFSFGIQHGRARLRLHYVWEAKRRYAEAQTANFGLAEELRDVSDSGTLRLSCLTRGLACAVKNADRDAQDGAVMEGSLIAAELDERDSREALSWFFFWRALAHLRQNQREEGRRLIRFADGIAFPIGFPTWRWRVSRQLAIANLLQITPKSEADGRLLLTDARREAASRGFHYLVQSIDDVFKHLDHDADTL